MAAPLVTAHACRFPTESEPRVSRARVCTALDVRTSGLACEVAGCTEGIDDAVGMDVAVRAKVAVTAEVGVEVSVAVADGWAVAVDETRAVAVTGEVAVDVGATVMDGATVPPAITVAVSVGDTGDTDGGATVCGVGTAGTGGVPGEAMAAAADPVGAAVIATGWASSVEVGTTVGAVDGFAAGDVEGVTVAPTSCNDGAPRGAACAEGVPAGGVISTPCPTNASATATRPTMPTYRFVRDPHPRINLPLMCNRMLAAWPALDIPLSR